VEVRRADGAEVWLRPRPADADGPVVPRSLRKESRALARVGRDRARDGGAHRAVDAKLNSRQRLGVGKILPGFMRPSGSNASFTRRIAPRSDDRNCSGM